LGAGNVKNVVLPEGASVVLALDGDPVGRKAAESIAQTMYRRGHQVFIAEMPDGSDPAALYSEKTS